MPGYVTSLDHVSQRCGFEHGVNCGLHVAHYQANAATGWVTTLLTYYFNIIVKTFNQGKTTLQNTDNLANSDAGRRRGQQVAASLADFALQYAAFSERNEDSFKKLLGNIFFFREFGNKNRIAR